MFKFPVVRKVYFHPGIMCEIAVICSKLIQWFSAKLTEKTEIHKPNQYLRF